VFVAFPFKVGLLYGISCSWAISTDTEVWVAFASGASATISSGGIMTSFLLLNVLVDDVDDGRRECPRVIEVPLPMAMPLLATDKGGGMEVADANGSGIVGSGGGRSAGPARLLEDEDTTDMGGAMDLGGAMDKGE
jgi:hypothetical protein